MAIVHSHGAGLAILNVLEQTTQSAAVAQASSAEVRLPMLKLDIRPISVNNTSGRLVHAALKFGYMVHGVGKIILFSIGAGAHLNVLQHSRI